METTQQRIVAEASSLWSLAEELVVIEREKQTAQHKLKFLQENLMAEYASTADESLFNFGWAEILHQDNNLPVDVLDAKLQYANAFLNMFDMHAEISGDEAGDQFHVFLDLAESEPTSNISRGIRTLWRCDRLETRADIATGLNYFLFLIRTAKGGVHGLLVNANDIDQAYLVDAGKAFLGLDKMPAGSIEETLADAQRVLFRS